MTIEASSMSWCSNASSVRSKVVMTRSSPPRAWTSSAWSSSRNCWRPGIRPVPSMSTEPAADVVLGLLLARVGEDLLGRVDLHQTPRLPRGLDIEKRGQVAGAARLLHVVGHDHDRVLLLELTDQILDRERGDRV